MHFKIQHNGQWLTSAGEWSTNPDDAIELRFRRQTMGDSARIQQLAIREAGRFSDEPNPWRAIHRHIDAARSAYTHLWVAWKAVADKCEADGVGKPPVPSELQESLFDLQMWQGILDSLMLWCQWKVLGQNPPGWETIDGGPGKASSFAVYQLIASAFEAALNEAEEGLPQAATSSGVEPRTNETP